MKNLKPFETNLIVNRHQLIVNCVSAKTCYCLLNTDYTTSNLSVGKRAKVENVSNYDSSKKSHCSVVEARDNKDTFEGGHLPFTTESTRKQQE